MFRFPGPGFRAFAVLATAWLAAAGAPGPEGRVTLTLVEQAWLSAHPVIRVGYDTREAPYSFLDRDGRVVGMDVDFLRVIGERTGLHFEAVGGDDWLATMRAPGPPPIDLLTDLGYLPGRESYLTYSEPYSFSSVVIITRDDAPRIVAAADLQNQRVGYTRGFEVVQTALRRAASRAMLVEFPDSVELLQAVASGQVFAAAEDVVTAAYFVRSRGMTHLRLGNALPVPDENYFGVRRDWPELVGILNKGIASLSPEERQAIANRWIGVDLAADRRWARAFQAAALTAAVIAAVLLLVSYHNRRLQRELTERRRVQRELEVARDHLSRVSAEKTKILNMVAHDLRSPLTSVMLNAELLVAVGPGSPRAASSPAQIVESSRAMARLIDELLAIHRLETGRSTLDGLPVDLAAVVRAVLREQEAAAARKQIELRLVAPASLPMVSDPSALTKIVTNLVSNAVKYSPPGYPVRVALSAGGVIRLAVRDEGPGVKPDERQRIFMQYGRGSARPTSGETSHGLGLWIVWQLVTELGGRVWCEDPGDGPGSLFVVELPGEAADRPA